MALGILVQEAYPQGTQMDRYDVDRAADALHRTHPNKYAACNEVGFLMRELYASDMVPVEEGLTTALLAGALVPLDVAIVLVARHRTSTAP